MSDIGMRLDLLAAALGARLLTGAAAREKCIRRVYAGDRMSDLLGAVTDETLLVTHVANWGLVNLIELMDVPAVCLVNGSEPDADVLSAARKAGAAILVSPHGMYETCGRLHRAMHASPGSAPSP